MGKISNFNIASRDSKKTITQENTRKGIFSKYKDESHYDSKDSTGKSSKNSSVDECYDVIGQKKKMRKRRKKLNKKSVRTNGKLKKYS